MKLLILQPTPASRHFLPLTFKYSPQHPVPQNPPSVRFAGFLSVGRAPGWRDLMIREDVIFYGKVIWQN